MDNNIIIKRTPEQIATEINTIKDQTKVMVLNNSIEIGRKLTEAKELISHGDFGKWLEASVSYSQRTANNLMKVYNEYGAKQVNLFGDTNSQAYANLSYSQAVALLSIPENEREIFVKENKIEDMSTRELQQAIKDKEIAQKEKEETLRKLRNLEKEKAILESDFSNKEQSFKASQETIIMLKETLKREQENSQCAIKKIKLQLDSAVDNDNTELMEQLKSSLDKKENELNDREQKIKELEQELRKKPVDITETIVEKVPDDVEKELQELRGKLKENEDTGKYRAAFTMVMTSFNELLSTLDNIGDTDIKEKYKIATKKLIDKMYDRVG